MVRESPCQLTWKYYGVKNKDLVVKAIKMVLMVISVKEESILSRYQRSTVVDVVRWRGVRGVTQPHDLRHPSQN